MHSQTRIVITHPSFPRWTLSSVREPNNHQTNRTRDKPHGDCSLRVLPMYLHDEHTVPNDETSTEMLGVSLTAKTIRSITMKWMVDTPFTRNLSFHLTTP
jgi:hypothetical protein